MSISGISSTDADRLLDRFDTDELPECEASAKNKTHYFQIVQC